MSFKLKIVTPEGLFYEGEVDSINLKLTKGYTGILPHHTPLVSMIEIGSMDFVSNGVRKDLVIAGGVLNVKKEETIILTDAIEYKEDIDINRAKKAEKRARERLSSQQENVDIVRAKRALDRSLARISLYEKK